MYVDPRTILSASVAVGISRHVVSVLVTNNILMHRGVGMLEIREHHPMKDHHARLAQAVTLQTSRSMHMHTSHRTFDYGFRRGGKTAVNSGRPGVAALFFPELTQTLRARHNERNAIESRGLKNFGLKARILVLTNM